MCKKYNNGIDSKGVVSQLMQDYQVRGIPHGFIFDKGGNIVWHGHPASCEDMISRLVGGEEFPPVKKLTPEEAKAAELAERAEGEKRYKAQMHQLADKHAVDGKYGKDQLVALFLEMGCPSDEEAVMTAGMVLGEAENVDFDQLIAALMSM